MGFSNLNPSQELKKRALLEKEEIAKRRLEALSRATRKLQDLNENEAPLEDSNFNISGDYNGISKERAKELKSERRTLKNRGYAATSRIK